MTDRPPDLHDDYVLLTALAPSPFRRRLRAAAGVFSDWRYPAALAAAMLIASVLIAQFVTLRGYREVLDRVDARTSTAECIDANEAEFDRLVVELIDAGFVGPVDVARAEAVRDRLLDVTDPARVAVCYEAEEVEE